VILTFGSGLGSWVVLLARFHCILKYWPSTKLYLICNTICIHLILITDNEKRDVTCPAHSLMSFTRSVRLGTVCGATQIRLCLLNKSCV